MDLWKVLEKKNLYKIKEEKSYPCWRNEAFQLFIYSLKCNKVVFGIDSISKYHIYSISTCRYYSKIGNQRRNLKEGEIKGKGNMKPGTSVCNRGKQNEHIPL